jgi:hypothetical protein
MVSAERSLVRRDGSASPVRGATGTAFKVVVEVGAVIVVEDDGVVVVVVSANALELNARHEIAPSTIQAVGVRRIRGT